MTVQNMVAVCNGKGGTLKSTMVSHVGAIAAAAGWRVLIVDADTQGNTSRDLGYVPDGGVALAGALRDGTALVPSTSEGRATLDYVPGGDALTGAATELGTRLAAGEMRAFRAFEKAVAPLAGHYDLVLVDSGPGDQILRRMILAAAHYVIVPCRTDETSIPDGLANLFRTIAEIREDANDQLEVLGVSLGPVRANETVRLARARERAVEVLGDAEIVFDPWIRDNGKIADDCRSLGIVATEYEARAIEAQATKVPWYKKTKAERDRSRTDLTFSRPEAAAGLAQDWAALTDEILARFAKRQAAVSA